MTFLHLRLLALILGILVTAARPCPAAVTPADEALRLAGLNAFWTEVTRAVSNGDFAAYRETCHEAGVLVSGSARTSYPLARALERWKSGFQDTHAGRMKATVHFRFSQRWGDATTAHETGIFRYETVDSVGQATTNHVHFEALLVKQGTWKVLMEYQKGPATQEEWDRLR